jgi:hypothetical protein
MLLEGLEAIFQRDLAAIQREVAAYPDEAAIWAVVPGLPNAGGVLVRHVCGNLQHFVGGVLNHSGYRRERDAEFGGAPWTRARLIAELQTTDAAVRKALRELPPEQLERAYPLPIGDTPVLTSTWLVHLAVHCGFHLGQLDYHRRSVTGDPASIAPMGVTGLAPAGSR